MSTDRIIVIGGGIAGVSVAAALSARGRDVLLIEAEAQLGSQSTGRSAAIFRLALAEPVNVRLAQRSRAIGQRVVSGGTVQAIGGLYYCDDADERGQILAAAANAGVSVASPDSRPAFLAQPHRPALFSPEDGVIDVHGLLHGLAKEALAKGARFLLSTRVDRLEHAGGRCCGVVVGNESLLASTVVDATGAWSDSPAVAPHRRHLFLLDSEVVARASGIIWDLSQGLYLRPESGGLLVSPCDELAMVATTDVAADIEMSGVLFDKLSRWAPKLAEARVRRVWAGLRPLTRDHRFIVGPDPAVPGLFRLGGFGGHGATAGAAAGEVAAALLCGELHPDAAALAPARPSLIR